MLQLEAQFIPITCMDGTGTKMSRELMVLCAAMLTLPYVSFMCVHHGRGGMGYRLCTSQSLQNTRIFQLFTYILIKWASIIYELAFFEGSVMLGRSNVSLISFDLV